MYITETIGLYGIDLPPISRTSHFSKESVNPENDGHDPYAYLKDVLTRLPTHKNSQIAELLPHRWQPLPT
jgi:hypothetical protein